MSSIAIPSDKWIVVFPNSYVGVEGSSCYSGVFYGYVDGRSSLSSAEAYMKFLVREKWARKEWWEELNKGSLCELMQSIWRRI
jgi:hypothetical protein